MEVTVQFSLSDIEQQAIADLLDKRGVTERDCVQYLYGAAMEVLQDLVETFLERTQEVE
jgi:hypothetical protein